MNQGNWVRGESDVERFRSGFLSSVVKSSHGYKVYAMNSLIYEEDGVRRVVPSFTEHGWPFSTWIEIDLPSPTTGDVLPEHVSRRVARALRWLGWSVWLQRGSGEIVETFESRGVRGELSKCRWSPLADANSDE